MMRDDKMPIMEHEVTMTSSDSAAKSNRVVGRSTGWKLAIITVVIFLCAFVFLMLFLVTPIFFSLNHPRTNEHAHTHTDNNNMTSHSHAEDEEHGDRRRRDVTDMQQQMMKLCGCDISSLKLTELHSCMQKCFSSGQRKNNNMRSRPAGMN